MTCLPLNTYQITLDFIEYYSTKLFLRYSLFTVEIRIKGQKGVEKQCKRAENVSMWQTNLIKLYCTVCDNSSTIESVVQRQSNNFRPQFSDEECKTVYLWGISQRRFEKKTIYEYTRNHLREWFPKLPSYQAFSDRLNKLAPAFQALAEHWMYIIGVNLHEHMECIVDSCPIILAKGPRSGHAKVAQELCEKSYLPSA